MNLFDLSGKVAIVTGSSRGIGRAIAMGLAEAGARVVISSRKQERCDETVAEIRAAGGEAGRDHGPSGVVGIVGSRQYAVKENAASSTALSAGLIPAAGTRFQHAHGIEDHAALFAADILRKAMNEPEPDIVECIARGAAFLVEWLRLRRKR